MEIYIKGWNLSAQRCYMKKRFEKKKNQHFEEGISISILGRPKAEISHIRGSVPDLRLDCTVKYKPCFLEMLLVKHTNLKYKRRSVTEQNFLISRGAKSFLWGHPCVKENTIYLHQKCNWYGKFAAMQQNMAKRAWQSTIYLQRNLLNYSSTFRFPLDKELIFSAKGYSLYKRPAWTSRLKGFTMTGPSECLQ